MTGRRPKGSADISGQLSDVHSAYRHWLGDDYDLGALDAVLSCAAGAQLNGDPAWLLLVGGSGAAKTETINPLIGGAVAGIGVSTINGEAGLLSGTPAKERAKDATGGLLHEVGDAGLLVIKDVTSILSMNRDTRALVLAALREVYDGHWTRKMGAEGGRTLHWRGRVVIIGAVTTAWDAAHQVIATMGDRFVLCRLRSSADYRRNAAMQAMLNVSAEREMRNDLSEVVGKLLAAVDGAVWMTDADRLQLLGLADIVTRARTPVERDWQGRPSFAHDLEMPTRYAKQLVQLVRGGLALGLDRAAALQVAERCAGDTMPPQRCRVLADVAANPETTTAAAVKRLQLPRATVDRVLQELHLLGLLVVDEVAYGSGARWIYSLADDVDRDDLRKLTRNVSTALEDRP